MSTNLQLKGDSRRRQLEQSRGYAEANGLELAEGAELEDIGVSAFRGANIRDGALGGFLDAIKSGAVKPGSYLLVESLDRLTRQELLKAQSLFLSIIQSGINVVTLADGRIYRAGTNDLGDLIFSLVSLSRAHEESQLKSHRHSENWKNKRRNAAAQMPMTKWCPAWLRLSDDRTEYQAIPERVEIVRNIFEDAATGMGIYSIATRLNRAGVPPFGDSNGWHTSYVAKILGNRAVLGDFQAHVRKNGKRIPVGETNRNYYPAVIDEELFYRAQAAKSDRRNSGAGRKGAAFSNLFSGLAICAYCKSPMKLENKGSGAKGGKYLICDGALRKLGCQSIRWRYQDFETSFLAFVQELDLESIINTSDDAQKRKRLDDELSALRGELASTIELMEKTYALLQSGAATEFVASKLHELTAKQSSLKTRLALKESERNDLNARDSRFYTSRDEIRELVKKLQMPPSDELFKLRAQIASRLKLLVQDLLIAPLGIGPELEQITELMQSRGDGDDDASFNGMHWMAARPEFRSRYFVVWFRNAAVRAVFPADGDPQDFTHQIITNPGEGPTFRTIYPPGGRPQLSSEYIDQVRDQDVPDELDQQHQHQE